MGSEHSGRRGRRHARSGADRAAARTTDRQRVLDRECRPFADLLARIDAPDYVLPTLHCSHCKTQMVRPSVIVEHRLHPETRALLCPDCAGHRPAPRVPAKALAVEDLPRPTA